MDGLPGQAGAQHAAVALHHGITERIAAEVDDMAMIRLMVREDAGLAVIPPIVVRDELGNGGLVGPGACPAWSKVSWP
ncbi:LysR substrate binding domain-containing protein [Nitrospirillum amazonense]|uniref:LysR substrate binding domain-containing protein n=1 Tax=Nitrospirillum amazonense TaxID=28077 RepID=A0A560EKP2_9PROT|nr:LysR substrate-binding domain-containing protein [Nitrospirillum amazonense]TWB09933.1 LysR substrate binding domain-containing protein [Nitrospirillum amazonense]